METWRDRARQAMAANGITQEQLAELMDMTQGGIQHWLAGSRKPSLEEINTIAKKIGVAPAWITHGLDQYDMLDGIDGQARETLRRLIHATRTGAATEKLWEAVSTVADLSIPRAEAPAAPPSPTLKKIFQRKAAAKTADFATLPTAVTPTDDPAPRKL